MTSMEPAQGEPLDLRNVIETIPALVVCALPDSSVGFVNRAWLEYTGLATQQPSESMWQSAIHPDDRTRFIDEWSEAVSVGKPFETEARVRSADGRYRWFLVKKTAAVLRTGKEKPSLGTLIAFEDIEERKQTERAREETQEQWRAAFENSPTMCFIVDSTGVMVSVNTFGAEQMGYAVSELLDRPMLDILYECDRQAVESHFRECFEHPGKTVKWETRKIRKDGSIVWVREKGNAVDFKKRRVLLIVCEDITEQKRAEDTALRSQNELRDVIKLVPAFVWTATPDGAIDFVNERWQSATGLMTMGEILGWNWISVLHPDDLPRVGGAWRAAIENREPMEAETRVRAANGGYRWWFCRNAPLRDEFGNIVKWYGIGIDIDDRKRAESLLAGEKRILEMVAKGESLAEILDGLCRLVEEQASGVLASILLVDGDRLRNGAAPTLPKAYTDAIDGALIGPTAGSCGTAGYRGEQVIVENIATDPLWADYRHLALPYSLRACWSTPVLSSQGKVIATFAMYYREPRTPSARDQEVIEQITHLAGVAIERKLTQEVLRRSEAHLTEAQKLAHMGSWVWEATSRNALHLSEEWYRIFGSDPGSLPTWEERLGRVHPEDRANFLAKVDRAIAEKSDYDFEFRIIPQGKPIRFIRSVGHPVLGPSGDLLQFLAVQMDVTEARQAEEERERMRQQLAHLAHLDRVSTIGELTASLAHEIKQPIGAAVTNAEACLRLISRDQPDLTEAREAALEMTRDARRAADIIDRVRSLYQKGSPRQDLVSVNDVIREMVEMLRDEASKNSVTMLTDLAEGLPKVMIDRVQLQQALMNLMLNGIEAMQDSAGELRIRSEAAEDGQLLVSIVDTGRGLPAGDEDRIFNPFVTTKPHGTGLGLAITRSIIESHGGRIRAFANSGPGATFQFALTGNAAHTA